MERFLVRLELGGCLRLITVEAFVYTSVTVGVGGSCRW